MPLSRFLRGCLRRPVRRPLGGGVGWLALRRGLFCRRIAGVLRSAVRGLAAFRPVPGHLAPPVAAKAAAPAAVMSAYNCINGVHAANSRDLCTVVLRQEWGFAGLVMSDWNTTVPQDGSTPWRCAWAGNDVIMPGNPHDDADIRAALADGRLPETAARQSAARLIALASALRGG